MRTKKIETGRTFVARLKTDSIWCGGAACTQKLGDLEYRALPSDREKQPRLAQGRVVKSYMPSWIFQKARQSPQNTGKTDQEIEQEWLQNYRERCATRVDLLARHNVSRAQKSLCLILPLRFCVREPFLYAQNPKSDFHSEEGQQLVQMRKSDESKLKQLRRRVRQDDLDNLDQELPPSIRAGLEYRDCQPAPIFLRRVATADENSHCCFSQNEQGAEVYEIVGQNAEELHTMAEFLQSTLASHFSKQDSKRQKRREEVLRLLASVDAGEYILRKRSESGRKEFSFLELPPLTHEDLPLQVECPACKGLNTISTFRKIS